MTDEQPSMAEPKPDDILLSKFLESVPPGQSRLVAAYVSEGSKNSRGNLINVRVLLPEIVLHCPYDICNGERVFRTKDNDYTMVRVDEDAFEYLKYECSNYQKYGKIFSLQFQFRFDREQGELTCHKLGELPPYGPPTPSRLVSLLGPGRALFLNGRRCENQGLGIGAFTYYRRVVEDQKDRILAEIIKVAEAVDAPPATIVVLKAAQKEHQFSKTMNDVKDAIPQRLLIQGQNPLTLLHSALSDGVHNQSDEKCLELATDIRLILAELAELSGHALKDERELKEAVARLRRSPS